MAINPQISIIVPNYNHAPFLRQRLDSIFNQTFKDFEVILLDDCSTDTSVELLKQYATEKRVSHFIVNKKNSGSPFKQWENGINLAKGTYIWIAESDDFCALTFLEEIIQFYTKNTSLGIVYSQTIDVTENGEEFYNRINYTQQFTPNIWEKNFTVKGNKFVKDYLSVKNVIPNASAVVFKKELICDTTFSSALLEMKMCGDWLFWMQLSLKTSVGFLNKELNYFRNHQNVSRNHSNLEVKIKRLLEEKEVRCYLQEKGFQNKLLEKKLYKKWFGLFKWNSIFKKEFYNIKFKEISTFKFLTLFINFKLSKRKLW